MRWWSTSVRLSSVRCPSCGHISKTKKDRPIVTTEHCEEDGTADSTAAFRSSLRRVGRDDRYLLGKARWTCHPRSDRYRLVLSVSTTNDWSGFKDKAIYWSKIFFYIVLLYITTPKLKKTVANIFVFFFMQNRTLNLSGGVIDFRKKSCLLTGQVRHRQTDRRIDRRTDGRTEKRSE